jgi:hypothetical protein
MLEICPLLFVGSQLDYEQEVRFERDWRVVHACREPYHREAFGYRGRSAPKDHPEYLVARRDDRLILNRIDADEPSSIPSEIMDQSLLFVHESLRRNRRVLVHCNQGRSRARAIGLLYLASRTESFSGLEFSEADEAFRGLYPAFDPSPGLHGFLAVNWSVYCRGHIRDLEVDSCVDREVRVDPGN